MFRLSLIINEIYNKYLPLAEKSNISLNLDFCDPTQTIDTPESIQDDLEKHLNSLIKNHRNGDRSEIKLSVRKNAITITDNQTILSKTLCNLLSGEHITVKSRIGFGTTVTIPLNRPHQTSISDLKDA